jgi:hypothetical protein
MHDHHHITKYNADFNEYATITSSDKRALYAKYYKGLAPRIKDGLVFSGRPNTLAELRVQTINLDLRCWERKDEERYKDNAISSQYPYKTPSGSPSSTGQALLGVKCSLVEAGDSRVFVKVDVLFGDVVMIVHTEMVQLLRGGANRVRLAERSFECFFECPPVVSVIWELVSFQREVGLIPALCCSF